VLLWHNTGISYSLGRHWKSAFPLIPMLRLCPAGSFARIVTFCLAEFKLLCIRVIRIKKKFVVLTSNYFGQQISTPLRRLFGEARSMGDLHEIGDAVFSDEFDVMMWMLSHVVGCCK